MELEIKKADVQYSKKMKIFFAVIFIIIVLGYFLLKSQTVSFTGSEVSSGLAIAKTILFIKWLSYCFSIVSLLFGIYFLRIAILIFKYSEFPPPNSKVMFDTIIKRGKEAKVKAWIALSISVLIIFLSIFVPVYVSHILQNITKLIG